MNVPLTLLYGMVLAVSVQTAVAQADNTKTNKRDQQSGAKTADQQKMNAADQEVTRNIRRAIVADKSLSTYAHNIKIITEDGRVTLKGPVKSDAEKKTVVAKAVDVIKDAGKVTDEISVSQ